MPRISVFVLAFLLSITPLRAAGPFGVNGDWDWSNLINGIGGWSSPTGATLTVDSNGWPQGDAQAVIFDNRRNMPWRAPDAPAINPNNSGTYQISFIGQANISGQTETGGGVTVQNQQYNTSANTTTAQLVFAPGHWLMILSFTNTMRNPTDQPGTGFTNMILVRPGFTIPPKQPFTPDTLKAYQLGKFSANRFLGVDGGNSYCSNLGNCFNGTQIVTAEWSDRVLVTDAYQGGLAAKQTNHHESWGDAWEYMIEIANQTNTDMWINVPVNADDNYVIQLATLIRNGDQYTPGLKANLHVYVEYSNEVWNFGFNQATINQAYAQQNGFTDDQQYIFRSIQIAQDFEQVFGPNSLNTTVRQVALWQYTTENQFFSDLAWAEQHFSAPVKTFLYGIGEAPYYNPTDTSTVTNIFNTLWTGSDSTRTDFVGWQSVASYFGLKEVGYEAGPSLVGGTGAYATRDPRMMASEMHHFLDNWFAVGGDQVNFFALRGAVSQFGDWLLIEDYEHLSTPKFQGAQNIVAASQPVLTSGFVLPWSGGQTASIDPSQRTPDPFSAYPPPNSGLNFGPGSTNLYLIRSASSATYAISLFGTADPGASAQIYVDDQLVGMVSPPTGSAGASTSVSVTLASGFHTLYLTGTGSGNVHLPAGSGTISIALVSGGGVPVVPSAPMNLTAAVSTNEATITWATTSSASTYNLKRSTLSGGPYTTVGSTAANSFTDPTALTGTTYYFVVTAVNSAGEGAVSPQIPVTITSPTAPNSPGPITIQSYGGDSTPFFGSGVNNLSWSAVPGAVTYDVKSSPVSGGPYNQIANVIAPLYQDLSANDGVTTYYVVTAVNSFGESSDSPEANGTPVEFVPPSPTALTATPGTKEIFLKWTPAPGTKPEFEAAFNVQRATVSGGPYTTIASLNAFNYADITVVSGATYYYVVSQTNAAGQSPNSKEISATAQ